MPKRTGIFRLGIVLFLVWVALVSLGKEKASFLELILATAIYFICFIPVLTYFIRSEKNIPYLPIFGIIYFIYFGLSIFNNYNLFIMNYLTYDTIIQSLNLALLGFISLMLAFYTPLGKIVEFIVVPLKIPWNHERAYWLGIFIGFLGLGVHYLGLSNRLLFMPSGLIGFIASLSRLGIAILFTLQLQNKLKASGKIFLWLGLFLPRIFLDLGIGSSFPIILDFMILFFFLFYYSKTIPWFKIITIALIFFVIFSVRDRFRELTWFDGDYSGLNTLGKSTLYIELICKRLLGEEKEEYRYAYEKLSMRTDNLVTFAKVVMLTPSYIPFWEGYTYRTLLASFLPRFIFPEKPEKKVGQEFGHRYLFLNPTDTITSYNLPMVIEMYVNFGKVGIIVGMFILGLIFRFFYALVNHPRSGEGGLMISVMIFINLLNIESDFSLVFGNLLQSMILFYIIIRFMKLPIKRIDI